MLLSTMLRQYSGVDFEQEPEKYDYWADRFEKLPIFLQSFFGSTDPDNILNIIDYAIYTYDVGHIILDNLQFMLSGQGKGFERFELQDDLISKLRNLATYRNVHISLVIHPKKTDDGEDLNVSSIFGTSKSTQESDNIYILQNRPKFKVFDIKKNRYDGEIGKAPLGFCRKSKRYYPLNNKDLEEIYNGKKMEEILKMKVFTVDEQLQKKEMILNKDEEFFNKLWEEMASKNGMDKSYQYKKTEKKVMDEIPKQNSIEKIDFDELKPAEVQKERIKHESVDDMILGKEKVKQLEKTENLE